MSTITITQDTLKALLEGIANGTVQVTDVTQTPEPTTERALCSMPTVKGDPCRNTAGKCRHHKGLTVEEATAKAQATRAKQEKFVTDMRAKAEARKAGRHPEQSRINRTAAAMDRANNGTGNGDSWRAIRDTLVQAGDNWEALVRAQGFEPVDA